MVGLSMSRPTPHEPSRSFRRIEREFGVPIPGEILTPDLWANTALKSLPEGRLDWLATFGRSAPVVLDLGCGNGRFVLGSVLVRPDRNYLGVDILPLVVRYATRRANQRGWHQVRFAVIGGDELLAKHVTPGSVAEIHVYHPQPYYEPDQIHRRLITPTFLHHVHRALVPSGLFVIQTDNPHYWRYIQEVVPPFFEFREHSGRWPDAQKGRTRREIIALRSGLPVFRGLGTVRPLSDEALQSLAAELPRPTFDADRRLARFDAMERE